MILIYFHGTLHGRRSRGRPVVDDFKFEAKKLLNLDFDYFRAV